MFSNSALKSYRQVLRNMFRSKTPAPSSIPVRKTEWAIGIYSGPSPCELAPCPAISNPVLTKEHVSDVRAKFVADPFMVRRNNKWFMFFEVLNRQAGRGEIGLAVSENGLNWTYQHIVLREPFHLSYPYVFEWQNAFYMVPESFEANSVRLYRASAFPFEWSFQKTLLRGGDFVDPSLVHFNDHWWMFVSEGPPPCRADTLRLFYTDDLMGEWHEHPQSPIVKGDPHIARPGGRVIVMNDRLIRYTQDCFPIYGQQLRAFEVHNVTTETYEERAVFDTPVLCATGSGWNTTGMHHIDPHLLDDGSWLACVDGSCRVTVGAGVSAQNL